MDRPLLIGFVLVPDFTMLALSAFLDTLRLAADEGDRSRPIDCRWTVMTEDGRPVRASNGVQLEPDGGLRDPSAFDYVVVAGGTLHRGIRVGERLEAWLTEAGAVVPLIGICTGSFVLAQAGLMAGRRSCVSWFHRAEFERTFPELGVCADRLFEVDGDRITCAGGTSVIHLASYLIDRHLGSGRSRKGLRVMIETEREAASPQPLPQGFEGRDIADDRVRKAILLIERDLAAPAPTEQLAASVGLSPRQLHRRFREVLGLAPGEARNRMRIARARKLLQDTSLRVTDIALRAGFADAAHLARSMRRATGCTPREVRAQAHGLSPSVQSV